MGGTVTNAAGADKGYGFPGDRANRSRWKTLNVMDKKSFQEKEKLLTL
jgi:hypothetical protein